LFENKSTQDILNAWKGLENAERGYEEWLLAELQRFEQFEG
jgi:hypothetical protein